MENVSKRFRDILKLWWSYAVADFARNVIALVAIAAESKIIAYVYQGFFITDLLLIVNVIILHIYRFQYAGKYCSGDFLASSDPQPGFLIHRGKYLLGLVIYCWVGFMVYMCMMGCLLTAASRRNAQRKYKKVQQH